MNHRQLRAAPICTLISTFVLFIIATIHLTARAAEPGARAGGGVFARRCSGCHALDADRGGPRLRGVLGRKAGSLAGFPYSEGLRNSRIVWDEAWLEKWLANPGAVVQDNDMEFQVANAEERRAVVAYLKSVVK